MAHFISLFLTFILMLSGCIGQGGSRDTSSLPRNSKVIENGLPVGFDREAGYIIFDQDGKASFQTITTSYPVLHFTGANIDGSAIAYTSLAAPQEGATGNRKQISLKEAMSLTIDDLVPSGELYIERDGMATMVSEPGVYVVSAAWSPIDANTIVYGYGIGEGIYGVTAVDLSNGEETILGQGDYVVDFLTFSDSGEEVGFFVSDSAQMEAEGEEITASWGFLKMDGSGFTQETTVVNDPKLLTMAGDNTVGFRLYNGDEIEIDESGSEPTVTLNKHGRVSRYSVGQVRHFSNKGLAFVNIHDGILELMGTDGSQEDAEKVARSVCLLYYLPFDTSVTVVQVGSGYSSSSASVKGCQGTSSTAAWSHKGTALQYAIDFQISTSQDDLYVGADGTIANFLTTATKNCYDTDCSIYSSTCSCSQSCSGSGYGNYAIIAHADGFYSVEAHMEGGSVQITTPATGMTIYQNCLLGDEGGTGKSAGNKNTCGDHLHFHWQNKSTFSSATGVKLGFVGVTFSSSKTWCGSSLTGTTAGMCCSL